MDENARAQATQAIISRLVSAVQAKSDADKQITDTLVQARDMNPPVPLADLARATGLSESGVSVRVSRAIGWR